MIRFFWKNRGSVSIFLVIILLPVMTAAALFVDAGKVSLGESVVASSADLALSTALTGYDQQLKDMYGLFATVQNTDDLFKKAEQYFMESMLMAEVSEGEAENEAKKLVKIVQQGGGLSDILNIQLESLDDFSITKRSDATLADAAIIEKQIVEFMKYRAPINTGLGFLSALESFGTLKEQTELVDKRTEYYTEQGEVLDAAQRAWAALSAYRLTKVGGSGGTQYLKNAATAFTKYKEQYENVVDDVAASGAKPGFAQKTIMDLYDTQDYDDFESNSMTLSFVDTTLSMTQKGASVEADISYSSSWNSDNMSDFNDAKEKFDDAIADYKNLKTSYFGADGSTGLFGSNGKYYYGTNGEGAYKLQYLVQANRDNLYEDWVEAVTDIYNAYCSMEAAYDAVIEEMAEAMNEAAEEEPVADSDSDAEDGTAAVEPEPAPEPEMPYTDEEFAEMDEAFSDSKSTIRSTLFPESGFDINDYTKEIEDNLGGAKAGVAVNATDSATVNEKIAAIHKEAADYYNKIVNAEDCLATAAECLQEIISNSKELAELQQEWVNMATTGKVASTDMGKNDAAEASKQGEVYDTANVKELLDRVTGVQAKLGEMKKAIESHAFFGKKLTDISGYSVLEDLLEDNINVDGMSGYDALKLVPITEDHLIDFIKEQVSGKYTGDALDASWVDESGTKVEFDLDKELEFYQELKSKFDGATANKDEMKLKDFEKANEELSSEAKDEENAEVSKAPTGKVEGMVEKDNEEHDIKKLGEKEGIELPSKGKAGSPEDNKDDDDDKSDVVGDATDNMPDFGTHLANFGSDIIEKLYIAEYIMSMFSYDTIEAEKKVKDDSDEIKLETLTKVPINSENNFAYAREIEYIIYGGGNGGNIAAAYASIFGIRLAFNLIYAFSNPDVRNTALSIATPISAATMGVVPVPLIQAVIIIGLACCESGIDLAIMKSGKKVQLIKDKDTWVSSISGVINKAKDVAKDVIEEVTDKVVDKAIDELSNVLDMGAEELNNAINYVEEDAKDTVNVEIQAAANSLNTAITGIYDKYITDTVNLVTSSITNTITVEVETLRRNLNMSVATMKEQAGNIASDNVDAVIDEIEISLKNLSASYSTGNGTDEDMSELVNFAVEQAMDFLRSSGGGLKDEIQGFIESMFAPAASVDSMLSEAEGTVMLAESKIMDFTTGIRDKISGTVNNFASGVSDGITSSIEGVAGNAKSWVNEKKEKLKTQLSDKLEEGGDKAKEFLTNKANGAISSLEDKIPDDLMGGATGVGDKKDSTGIASHFAFGYSDYLRLFIIIGLYTGEESLMLRTADVIQANMMMKNGDNSYKLSESGVYLDLDVKVMVKPTLLPLPLFADLEYNHVEDANWYTLTYSDTRGY